MKIRTEYTCPLELTHDITKGKWKPMILWQLGKGTHSLSVLKKEIRGDRKSTRLNSSHSRASRMPSSA